MQDLLLRHWFIPSAELHQHSLLQALFNCITVKTDACTDFALPDDEQIMWEERDHQGLDTAAGSLLICRCSQISNNPSVGSVFCRGSGGGGGWLRNETAFRLNRMKNTRSARRQSLALLSITTGTKRRRWYKHTHTCKCRLTHYYTLVHTFPKAWWSSVKCNNWRRFITNKSKTLSLAGLHYFDFQMLR